MTRLDKWLWAARFYKTRSVATDAIAKHRIEVGGQVAKASRDVKVGDLVRIHTPGYPPREVAVRGLSDVRGPAPVAQLLYEETEASRAAAAQAQALRRQGVEPALTLTEGRPTKRDRRKLAEWTRWRAEVPD